MFITDKKCFNIHDLFSCLQLLLLSFITLLLIYVLFCVQIQNKNILMLMSLFVFIFVNLIIYKAQKIRNRIIQIQEIKRLMNENKYIDFTSWTDKIMCLQEGLHKNNFTSNKCRAYIYYTKNDEEYMFLSPAYKDIEYPYQVGGTFRVYTDIQNKSYTYYMEYLPPQELLDSKGNLIIYQKSLKYKMINSLKYCGFFVLCTLGFLVSLCIFKERLMISTIMLLPVLFYLIKYCLIKKRIKCLKISGKSIIARKVSTKNNQDYLASAIYTYQSKDGKIYNFRATHLDTSYDINKVLKHNTINSSDIIRDEKECYSDTIKIFVDLTNPQYFCFE